jgi:hypothetical protein
MLKTVMAPVNVLQPLGTHQVTSTYHKIDPGAQVVVGRRQLRFYDGKRERVLPFVKDGRQLFLLERELDAIPA